MWRLPAHWIVVHSPDGGPWLHEVVAHSTKKIKIPNACIGVGVRYVSPFRMLRAELARVVIAS